MLAVAAGTLGVQAAEKLTTGIKEVGRLSGKGWRRVGEGA